MQSLGTSSAENLLPPKPAFRSPLRIGIVFTLLILGLNLGTNLLIGGFDPQIHQLLLRDVSPEALVTNGPPPAFAEMPPPKDKADVAHMAFEVVLTDFFPQSLYNTVYVFLISLFAANTPMIANRELRIITWMVGLGGFTFALVFLITALLTPTFGPAGHAIARTWLFPIPALMIAIAFTWTIFAHIAALFIPAREEVA
ncbi:hypothetical protein MNBD_ACTINO02-1429 [hydrothermal vent metagenome]|uniref:Uncharacterized protein n=1 Tax=hydrothermal vent metagenome TaxID=652676 RepID=A0A3B0SYR4_9ZZZZ